LGPYRYFPAQMVESDSPSRVPLANAPALPPPLLLADWPQTSTSASGEDAAYNDPSGRIRGHAGERASEREPSMTTCTLNDPLQRPAARASAPLAFGWICAWLARLPTHKTNVFGLDIRVHQLKRMDVGKRINRLSNDVAYCRKRVGTKLVRLLKFVPNAAEGVTRIRATHTSRYIPRQRVIDKSTHSEGPRVSNAIHQRPRCSKYSNISTTDSGRPGRLLTTSRISISILKSKSVSRFHQEVECFKSHMFA